MSLIFQLTYMSRARGSSAENVCQNILAVSRKNNSKLDVTGVLICNAEHFIQALEGPETIVRMLLDKIAKDRRHDSIQVLKERIVPNRQFGGWAMAYSDRHSNGDLRKRARALLADTQAAALV